MNPGADAHGADGETLRSDAEAILRGGLGAVDPTRLVADALADEPRMAEWSAQLAGSPPLTPAVRHETVARRSRTILVAVGKAALGMTRGAVQILGDMIDRGVVVVPGAGDGHPRPSWLPPAIELRFAGHPAPDLRSASAGTALLEVLRGTSAGDRVLALISGGASALACSPVEGVPLGDLARATEVLLESGLPIREINRVRKTLDRVKGGGLAEAAAPADVLALVISDVVGDDPAVVGSGPFSPEEVSARKVQIGLRRAGVWARLPESVRGHLEAASRKEPVGAVASPAADRSREAPAPLIRMIGTGQTALEGAAARARKLGYTVHVLATDLAGEARLAGRGVARAALAVADGVVDLPLPACLLASGETTVKVTGGGRGGRNQEAALGAARLLDGRVGIVVGAMGTDGVDGPTDAAGGIVDGGTVTRARAAGFDLEEALAANDAYPLLDAVGGLLRTGPTGTNVADLFVAVVGAGVSPGVTGPGTGS
jgi:glycerate-2-kinase